MSLLKRKRTNDPADEQRIALSLRETQSRTIDNVIRVERIARAARIVSARQINGAS